MIQEILQVSLQEQAKWMHWTVGSVTVIVTIVAFIFVSGLLDQRHRSTPTKGFLPMTTTRGDRIFLSLVLTITIGLIWLLLYLPFYLAIVPALIVTILILKKG